MRTCVVSENIIPYSIKATVYYNYWVKCELVVVYAFVFTGIVDLHAGLNMMMGYIMSIVKGIK